MKYFHGFGDFGYEREDRADIISLGRHIDKFYRMHTNKVKDKVGVVKKKSKRSSYKKKSSIHEIMRTQLFGNTVDCYGFDIIVTFVDSINDL